MILTITPNPAIDRTVEIPEFHAGGTFAVESLGNRCAGKGINVSRVLAGLGVKSVCAGLVGRGEVEWFGSDVEAAGGLADFVSTSGRVRLNTTVIDPQSSGETHIREPGETVSAAEIEALCGIVSGRASAGSWVVGCGSLPPGMTTEDYARVLSRAIDAGARVAVDSSSRGLGVVRAVKTDLVKPNLAELVELCGREIGSASDALGASRDFVESTPATLLVTLGADGALLVERGSAIWMRCEPESIVSSVGAGDASLAGYLWADAEGLGPDERLRAAVAAGAASLSEAVAGQVDVNRFERLRKSVEVVPVD